MYTNRKKIGSRWWQWWWWYSEWSTAIWWRGTIFTLLKDFVHHVVVTGAEAVVKSGLKHVPCKENKFIYGWVWDDEWKSTSR